MAQCGEDPALDNLNADLDLGLVARAAHPSGEDGEAVVLGEVGVGGVSVGLEAMGAGDRRGEIVRNHQLRDAVKEPQRPHVRGAPVRERLGPVASAKV